MDTGLMLAMSRATNRTPTQVSPLNVTESGTYNAGEGKAYNPVNVNIPSGAPLNIEYSQTAPTDTTKLWVKCDVAVPVECYYHNGTSWVQFT